jgi:transposase
MPEHRRRFSPQFKAEAVQLVFETGKPIAKVARDLGIHDGTLENSVNAWHREHLGPDQPLSPGERARVKELEVEVARPRMENEFLKSSGLLRAGAPAWSEKNALSDTGFSLAAQGPHANQVADNVTAPSAEAFRSPRCSARGDPRCGSMRLSQSSTMTHRKR